MTQDTPRIDRHPDPRKPADTDARGRIDPNKFKKILEVDASDASEQRKRSNTQRQEEGDEESIHTKDREPPEPEAFQSFLRAPDNNSMLTAKKGTPQGYSLSSPPPDEDIMTSPPPHYPADKDTMNLSTDESPPISVDEEDIRRVDLSQERRRTDAADDTKKQPRSLDNRRENTTDDHTHIPIEKDSSPPSKKEKKTQSQDLISLTAVPDKKKKKPVSPGIGKIPEDNLSQVKKKTHSDPPHTPNNILPHDKEKKSLSDEKTSRNSMIVGEKAATIPAEKEQKKKKEQGEPVHNSLVQGEKPSDDFSSEHPPQEEETHVKPSTGHVVEPTTILTPNSGVASTAPVGAYSFLQDETFELFQKMLGILTIESYNGISKTTVTLNLPHSIYDGCHVEIDHYDTAPHSFNIQLSSPNPEAIKHLHANMAGLLQAFHDSKLSYDINMRTPVLSHETRHLIKRKGGMGQNSDRNSDGKK